MVTFMAFDILGLVVVVALVVFLCCSVLVLIVLVLLVVGFGVVLFEFLLVGLLYGMTTILGLGWVTFWLDLLVGYVDAWFF